ncbi:MAG TPA: tetratricopeptide repeat protein [Patescibacteria group bacterium]|nr:tetratricopeptide repeat protein [Patescibacteria group bacterium]
MSRSQHRASNEKVLPVVGNLARFRSSGKLLVTLAIQLLLCFLCCARAEETVTNTPPSASSETNSQEILRAYLQLQEQLQLTQLAVEQNRKEARETAAQNAELLAGRLHALEQALELQRNREMETMQTSNRVLLVLAGSFASVGLIAVLLMSFFQWRTVNRLAQLPGMSATASLSPGSSRGELSQGAAQVLSFGAAEQSSLRLLGAVEQLEKRLHQLEHTTHTSLADGNPVNGAPLAPLENGAPQAHAAQISSASDEAERLAVLLGKGQSMLNLDDIQAAVNCFDEALAIDPHNAEAWVRKGTALERLQQLDQAIDCYDRAIQSDGSLTIAYLHKGGLFNRMERFNEALDCYEKALRTQEKRRS